MKRYHRERSQAAKENPEEHAVSRHFHSLLDPKTAARLPTRDETRTLYLSSTRDVYSKYFQSCSLT